MPFAKKCEFLFLCLTTSNGLEKLKMIENDRFALDIQESPLLTTMP